MGNNIRAELKLSTELNLSKLMPEAEARRLVKKLGKHVNHLQAAEAFVFEFHVTIGMAFGRLVDLDIINPLVPTSIRSR